MAVNKSEEIRRVANELKLRGEIVRPKSILDIFKETGNRCGARHRCLSC